MEPKDYSRNEGDLSAENMRPSTLGERHPLLTGTDFNRPAERNPGGGSDIIHMLADVSRQLSEVKADNAQLRAEIDKARKSGELDFPYEHVAHVMQKYFPHDVPEPDQVAPAVPKFDMFTGQPLN